MLVSFITLPTLHRKIPVALTWWVFIFPVGTCVTGTTQLALNTRLSAFEWAAIILFSLLIGASIITA
jgi:tellurite resistance protein TehA-like permease